MSHTQNENYIQQLDESNLKLLSKETKDALESLIAAPALAAARMNKVTAEIRAVQDELRKIPLQWIGDVKIISVQINGPDNHAWRLEYDIGNKVIYCQHEVAKEKMPILEQKFKIREYMIEFLPDLIKALEAFK